MSFELQTQTDPKGVSKEVLEETITKTEQTYKFWSKREIEESIALLQARIEVQQARKATLEEQLKLFSK